jgi:probable F420-dependent oxidoreductase
MRFGFHTFMIDPAEYPTIGQACDDYGWDDLAFGDSPYHPETIEYPYPYTPDGKRFWPIEDPILDPWVACTQIAVLTKRVRVVTSVLRLSVRKPLLEAKAAASVAYVSNNRLAVGIGLAWMAEEFKWLKENKKTRGARVDEAIQIIRLCTSGGGLKEFHGQHYEFDRIAMEPHPSKPVPILVGGLSEGALRRAARYGDGWLGALHSFDEIKRIVPDIMRQRKQYGLDKEPFEITLQCPEATTVGDIHRLEDLGVTTLWIVPWVYYGRGAEDVKMRAEGETPKMFNVQPPVQVKVDAIKRYGDEIISKFK